MKVEAINFSKVNKIQLTKPKTQYHSISFGGEDEFAGKRQYKKYHEVTPIDSVSDMDIDDLVIKRANLLSRLYYDYISSDVMSVKNSIVANASGYPKCILALRGKVYMKNINKFDCVFVRAGNSVGNITNTKNASFNIDTIFQENTSDLDSPKGNFINVDYCRIADCSEINKVESHAAFLTTGANVKDLKTNKLLIVPYNEYYSKLYKDYPSEIDNALVVKENITSVSNNLSEDIDFLKHHSKYSKFGNGFADIDFCKINNLKCELLNAKNAELNNVNSTKCDDIIDCKINKLETHSVKNIQNSQIDKLISNSDKFILNTDELSDINSIEFANSNGTLLIKNNNDFIPDVNVINGLKEYRFEGIQLGDFTAQKILTAQKDVQINTLTVTEPDAVVTIVGNSKIDNIEFKKGGKVILKNDAKGIYPDASKINVINGEIVKDYPLKGFEKIAGMEDLKQQLREDVIEPLEHPEIYKKYGLDVINGFLLYGPPGCGKTFVAKQLAEETGRYFVQIGPSQVGSTYQHKTILNIKQKFEEAIKNAPAIVFIDEAESIAPRREALSEAAPDYNAAVTELLQQLNNCKDNNILVVIASNEPQRIDNAIKRTGRMDKKIFVGQPDTETRKALFTLLLSKVSEKVSDIDVDKLAELSEYYTAEDIKMVLRQASLYALKRKALLNTDMIINALRQIEPSLSENLVNQYKTKGDI